MPKGDGLIAAKDRLYKIKKDTIKIREKMFVYTDAFIEGYLKIEE
jgi:hypothetical protein